MRVAIAGGGIGGLATAIACRLRGIEAVVFERAPQYAEVGAGLQISANGWKVLEALGVGDALTPMVFETPTIDMRLGHSGRRLWRMPIRRVSRARWGGPYVHVHRADLANALAERLETLAPGALRTGHTLTRYEDGLRLVFDEGGEDTADFLIGADGLHSAVRRQMLGSANPDYTGNLAWRAVVPVEMLGQDAPPANTTIWAGQGRHAVTTRLRGGGLVNFVGLVERPEPSEEGWRIEGDRDEALRDFATFSAPITGIIERAEKLHRWALYTRAPLPKWSEGAVTLVGDAAHPMLPSMAQGAGQALEDAWVLAALLADDPASAGSKLYALRRDRTAKIQHASAANARMFHRAGPLGTPIYYGGMAAVTGLFPGVLLQRQAWVYAHDVVAEHPLS